MTKTSWSDPAYLGRSLKSTFKRMEKRCKKEDIETKDLVALSNSMAHTAMQIVNLTKATETNDRLDKVESLIALLPKETIDQLKQKMIAQNGT